MIRIKCPACTVELEVEEGTQPVVCEYCGTAFDLPAAAAEEPAGPVEEAAAAAEEAAAPEAPAEAFYAAQSAAEEAPAEETYAQPAPERPAYSPIPDEPAPKKKGKGGLIALIAVLLLLLGGGAFVYFKVLKPANEYKAAVALMEEGDYLGAIDAFEALGDYKDAAAKIDECLVKKAGDELSRGKYSRAAKTLKDVSDKKAAEEAVYSAFKTALEKADGADDVSAVLEELGSFITDEDRYEEAAETAMTMLLQGGNDRGAEDLYYALGKLDADGILTACVGDELVRRLNAGEIDGAVALVNEFSGKVPGMTGRLAEKVGALITAGDPDGAFSLIRSLEGYGIDMVEEKYKVGKAFLEFGRYAEAAELFESISDYEDSADMAKEAKYQNLLVVFERNDLSPEEFADCYRQLRELDGYGDSDAYIMAVLEVWYNNIVYGDQPQAYADALVSAVSLSIEESDEFLDYIVTDTPELAGLNENGRVWYGNEEQLDAIRTVLDEYYYYSDSDAMQGFRHFVTYMNSYEVTDLPKIDEIWELWDLREDIRVFSSTAYPLLAFLVGSWSSGTEGETFTMTRKEDDHYSLHYDLPLASEGGYLGAMNFGLSIVDENKEEVARICDIEIIDFDTIRIHNAEDDKDYTMTRQAE